MKKFINVLIDKVAPSMGMGRFITIVGVAIIIVAVNYLSITMTYNQGYSDGKDNATQMFMKAMQNKDSVVRRNTELCHKIMDKYYEE